MLEAAKIEDAGFGLVAAIRRLPKAQLARIVWLQPRLDEIAASLCRTGVREHELARATADLTALSRDVLADLAASLPTGDGAALFDEALESAFRADGAPELPLDPESARAYASARATLTAILRAVASSEEGLPNPLTAIEQAPDAPPAERIVSHRLGAFARAAALMSLLPEIARLAPAEGVLEDLVDLLWLEAQAARDYFELLHPDLTLEPDDGAEDWQDAVRALRRGPAPLVRPLGSLR